MDYPKCLFKKTPETLWKLRRGYLLKWMKQVKKGARRELQWVQTKKRAGGS